MRPNPLRHCFYFFATLFLFASCSSSEKTVHIQVNGLTKNDKVILAAYLGEKLYPKDTLKPSEQGLVSFNAHATDSVGKAKYPEGMYALYITYLDSTKQAVFDFLLTPSESIIELQTTLDENRMVQNTTVKESTQNKIFYDYLQFLVHKQDSIVVLNELKKDATPEKAQEIEGKIKAIQASILAHQAEMRKQPSSYVYRLLQLGFDSNYPDFSAEKDPALALFEYAKQHYWEGVNFQEESLANNGLMERKLSQYFDALVPMDNSIIIGEIDRLMAQIPEGTNMYRLFLQVLLSKYQYPQQLCSDAVFVHLIDQYVKTGKAHWIRQDMVKKIIEKSDAMKRITCGQIAPEIKLVQPNLKDWMSMHAIDAKYTVLVFWSVQCGHCVRDIPRLAREIKQFNKKDVQIFAVEVELEVQPWIDFIQSHPELNNFINVSDIPAARDNPLEYINAGKTDIESLNYRKVYDIYATPTIMLLDKDKKVMYKNLTVDSVQSILAELLHAKKK